MPKSVENALLMAEPKAPQEVARFWFDKLRWANDFRDQHPYGTPAWERYFELYQGDHWGDAKNFNQFPTALVPPERLTVNETASIIFSLRPFLTTRQTTFKLKPKQPSSVITVAIKQALLNKLWRQHDMRKPVNAAVLDALIYGFGVVKSGFILDLDEEFRARDDAGATTNYNDFIEDERPFLRRVSPFNFYWDYASDDTTPNTSRWLMEVMLFPALDVVNNPQYSKAAIADLRANPNKVAAAKEFNRTQADSSGMRDLIGQGLIPLIEVWDKRSKKRFLYAAGIETPLIDERAPFEYLKKPPYEFLSFDPVPDDPFPRGIPRLIEHQQIELNRTATTLAQHRRRFNTKVQVPENTPPEVLDKLENGADGTIVPFDGRINPIQAEPVASDQYRIQAILADDIRNLTGVDELLRGGGLGSRTTATEANVRQEFTGTKLRARSDEVDFLIRNLGIHVIEHAVNNFQTPQVVEVVGELGSLWISQVNPKELQADFDAEVTTASADVENPAMKRQQKLSLFDRILSQLPVLGQLIDVKELLKWVLDSFDDDKDIGRFFAQQTELPKQLEETPNSSNATSLERTGSSISDSVPFGEVTPEQIAALSSSGSTQAAVAAEVNTA